MAGASIEVAFDLDDLNRLSSGLLSGLEDVREPLDQCSIALMRSVDDNFRAQGRPTKWKSLSKLTLAMRRGTSAHTLVDTGRLRQSVTWKAGGGSPVQGADGGSVFELTPKSLTVGTNLKYAAIHQFGGVIVPVNKKVLAAKLRKPLSDKQVAKRNKGGGFAGYPLSNYSGETYVILGKKVTIPARPFLVVQQEDEEEFAEIFASWTEDYIKFLYEGKDTA